MNAPSAFQAEYPLSPKKFWKKIIACLPVSFFSALSFAVVVDLLVVVLTISENKINIIATVLGFILPFLLLFFGILFVYGIYVNAYIKRYYYDVGAQFITIQKGVFSPSEIHVQYQKIQDVYVDQDILDRLMGLYDVHIASATMSSGIAAHIDGLNANTAEALKNLLLNKIINPGNAAPVATTSSTAKPANIQLNEKVSSQTFPIAQAWIASVYLKSLINAMSWPFFVGFLFYLPGRHSSQSLSDIFGFSNSWMVIVPMIYILGYIVHVVSAYWWRKTFYFEFSPEYILVRQGIIAKQEQHVPYRTVQDVILYQGLIDKMFGICTVTIQNAVQVVTVQGRTTTSGLRLRGLSLVHGRRLVEISKKILEQINGAVSTGV